MLLLHDKVVSHALSLFFILVSLAVAFGMKEAFTSSLLSDLRMSLKDLSKVLPKKKPKTPFLDVELLLAISDYLGEYLEKGISFRKMAQTSYFLSSLAINLLLMPIAILILLVSNEYKTTYQWCIPFLLAIIVSFVNAWLILPKSESRNAENDMKGKAQARSVKKGVIREAINLLLLIVLLRRGYVIGEKRRMIENIWVLFLFSIGLIFLINPGDLLIPSRRKENSESHFQPKKIAFVFIPPLKEIKGLPAMCSEEEQVDKNKNVEKGNMDLLSKICKIAYKEIGLTPQYVKYSNKTNKKKKYSNSNIKEKFTICTSSDLSTCKEEVLEEVIQRSELVYSNLKKEINKSLNSWMVEFLDFEKLKCLLRTSNTEEVIECLYKYSLIETTRKTFSNVEIMNKLWGLFSDDELMNSLGDLSDKFAFILPVVYVYTEPIFTAKFTQIQRGCAQIINPEGVFFIAYYCIPVLIALNPLMNPHDFEELYNRIEASNP